MPRTIWTSGVLASANAPAEQGAATRRRHIATAALTRRSVLHSAVAGVASMLIGTQLGGCFESAARQSGPAPEPSPSRPSATGSKILLVYFSRAGENYYYGDRTHLEVGNTEVLAGMISRRIECDVYRIEPVDPYPDDYSETVERNVREQDADARPAIADPLASIEGYDIVLLGSPIWNVRAPMIMSTFAESFGFSGKTIFPFTTHAMSGLGTTERDYAASCPGATLGEGLAVRGEEVRAAGAALDAWLRRIGLLEGR